MNSIFHRIAMFLLWALSSLSAAPKTMAFHYTGVPSANWLEENKTQVKKLAALGYNLVIIQSGNNTGPLYRLKMGAGVENGVPVSEIKKLVQYARSQLQLEITFEMKIMGKAKRLLGADFIAAHPGVVEKAKVSYGEDVWNPQYVTPEGKSLYEGVIFPLFNELLEAYEGKLPKYLVLGTDEADKASMEIVAKRMNLTRGELMAKEFNVMTSLLIRKGITPLIWADMLTSHKLAEKNDIEGWPGDKRFSSLSELNGDSDHFGGGSVMDGVLKLSNRDKIVACDWHYFEGTPEGDYPCLDYLRWLGFKEVWPTTWYSEKNIKGFAEYAKRLGAEGMVATTWHTSVVPMLADIYQTTMHNSVAYFKNPGLPVLKSPRLRVRQVNEKNHAVLTANQEVTLEALAYEALPKNEGIFFIRQNGSAAWEESYPCAGEVQGGQIVFSLKLPSSSKVFKTGLFDAKFECFDSHQRLNQSIENALFYLR